MRRTEIAVREEIRKIPDGVYIGAAATDDDGTTLDEQVWVRATITMKGDEMTIDLSESDAQRKGFVNCVYAVTYGIAIAAAILYFDPALADYHNQGTMKPIKVIAPPGSVVNCQYPATVGASPVNVGCPDHGSGGRGTCRRPCPITPSPPGASIAATTCSPSTRVRANDTCAPASTTTAAPARSGVMTATRR